MQLNPNIRNGRYCMLLISQFLEFVNPELSLYEFCQQISSTIKKVYITKKLNLLHLKDHPIERLTASVIIYNNIRKEIWMIGDCQCMIDGIYYDNPKQGEHYFAQKRSNFIKMAIANGQNKEDFEIEDKGRTYILPELIDSCKYQNIKYAVVDGFPIPMNCIKVIPTNGAKEIVLSSDGYPFLKRTLHGSEEELSKLLRLDPLCINLFLATKGLKQGNNSFDDRAYIRISL